MPRTIRTSELPNANLITKIMFTLNDSFGLPLNGIGNGGDSVQWYLPSLDDLGVNKTFAPTYNFILHWAPGYAFEFAGTFVKYDLEPTIDSGNSSRLYTKYFNIYFAHDNLYWFQGINVRGWHFTPSISVRVVFRDNNRHPWQLGLKTEEYFDPTKRKTVRKTVVIEIDEED